MNGRSLLEGEEGRSKMTPEMIKTVAVGGIVVVAVLGLIYLAVLWWSRR